MIQMLLGLILLVLVFAVWGDEIKSDAIEIGSGVADIFNGLPTVTHVGIGLVVMAVCIGYAFKIIHNSRF